jgi:hypothetical protein
MVRLYLILLILGAKFIDSSGDESALFIYKSVHRCNHLSPRGQVWLYDSLSSTTAERARAGDSSFMSKASYGPRLRIHSVTTELSEAYFVGALSNMTKHLKTESDIR